MITYCTKSRPLVVVISMISGGLILFRLKEGISFHSFGFFAVRVACITFVTSWCYGLNFALIGKCEIFVFIFVCQIYWRLDSAFIPEGPRCINNGRSTMGSYTTGFAQREREIGLAMIFLKKIIYIYVCIVVFVLFFPLCCFDFYVTPSRTQAPNWHNGFCHAMRRNRSHSVCYCFRRLDYTISMRLRLPDFDL